jgi:cytochrome c
MKHILLVIAIIALLSCNEDKDNKENNTNSLTTVSEGGALVAANDCATCHHETKFFTGPSYEKIAIKYNPNNINDLAQKIIKGSSGVWGGVPMMPHSNITEADAQKMVTYILSFKNR